MSTTPIPLQTLPLNATFASFQITLGSVTQQVALASPIEGYIGDELFVHSSFIDPKTLAVTIDQTRPQSTLMPLDKYYQLTTIALTVTYDGSTSTQTFPLEATYDGEPLAVSLKLSTDLSTAYLFVANAAPPVEPGSADTFLGFILVQDVPAEDGDALYRMNWVGPVQVQDYLRFDSATIVLPPASGGSITGPMGLQMP